MQTRVVDQPAFVLHKRDWQNSSLLLCLLSRDYGRVDLLAKGAKNRNSGALFQPFSKVSISWSGHRDLKTLVAIEGSAVEIAASLYLPLLYINELLSTFLPGYEASPEIFTQYDTLLAGIRPDNRVHFLCEFERLMMRVLGYMPDTWLDCVQEKPIDVNAWYQFQVNRGFVPCGANDKHAIKGQSINFWNHGDYKDPAVVHLAKTIMRCVIESNLQGKRLKFPDVYAQMKNWR